MRQYPYFVRLFHTSTPLGSVELRMKKESRDLVASTGHLCSVETSLYLVDGKPCKIVEQHNKVFPCTLLAYCGNHCFSSFPNKSGIL